MAVYVDRNRADGPVLDVGIESLAALSQQLVKLAPPLRRHEPAIRHLLQTGFAGEVVSAFITHQHMWALLHDRPGRADRGPSGTQPGNRAAPPIAPVHDRRVKLDMAVIG